MRITDVRTTLVHAGWRNWTFVQVFTDDGFVGLGEGTLRSREHAVAGAITDMTRVLLGQDPRLITAHTQTLYRDFHKRGGVVSMTAIGGIEIALWDIVGQWLGQPIHALLGGRIRDVARAYDNGWADGVSGPDELARRAGEAVREGRVGALKWNPFRGVDGWPSPASTRQAVAAVEAVRAAVGDDVELMIEAHGLFTPAAALRMADRLAPYRPFWFEEPVPPEDVVSMAFVRARSSVPIAAGERLFSRYELADLLEARAVDIVQPDVQNAGGLAEVRWVAGLADVRYVGYAPHNSGSPVGTAASLHLAATTPNFVIQELPTHDVGWRDEIVEPPVERLRDGSLAIPMRPGLGVSLNEQVAAAHPYDDPDRFGQGRPVSPESERLARRLRPADGGTGG